MIPMGMREKKCHVCDGRGIIPTPDRREWQLCPLCKGRGKILAPVDWYTPSYREAWIAGR